MLISYWSSDVCSSDLLLQIDSDTLLAAVQHDEVNAVLAELGLIGSHFIASARALDLHNPASRLGQPPACHGPRPHGRHITDAETFQCSPSTGPVPRTLHSANPHSPPVPPPPNLPA